MYVINYSPFVIYNEDENFLAVIERKLLNSEPLNEHEVKFFLTDLCYQTRKLLTRNIKDACTNKCDTAQSMISSYLTRLQVPNHPCATQNVIVSGITGHSFLTATINVGGTNTNYLIDPTYQQFLLQDKCTEKNYFSHQGIDLLKPDPGYYIKEEDKSTIEEFTNRGYAVLTDELAQIYGDSFYNTKQGTLSKDRAFKTMPGSVYINAFLKGHEKLSKSDEQLKEEEIYLEEKVKEEDYIKEK